MMASPHRKSVRGDGDTHPAEHIKVFRETSADVVPLQIKYFKDKRVMEYNRDQTIAKIKADDAQMVAKQKAEKKGRGLFG